mmetsp:Transcript_5154/g.9369  ORF Transcript_5154/g.9369 Transcript_5154/m.9369 type:complete len:91 (-) Transcript_5154:51-323(-)|eukprot:CAMPEP_0201609820 /NCGR_PEP_ID=MMETSP0492-20130828/14863_1 /ASSEMBLY_ACC=CAM_ASM_000837 /TAXON_ID=420259 /ORGANISM="Thalassiosira gravida, Strain GMp14c1" /LENGTH=90 /DNA_ID=CAMNT_0048075421 /DNA_START=10 /DNA_END=282 /DNA_ORIENTATION=+
MALRRPPTRIELKADDVEEYDKIMKDRRLIAEQQAMREQSSHHQQQQQQQHQHKSSSGGSSPSDNFLSSGRLSSHKKPSAAERIGYRRPR